VKIYLVSDSHFNHTKIATYCDRPENFTDILVRNWQNTVKPEDSVIHLGDVFIGKPEGWAAIYPLLPGRKILVRGNHDRNRSVSWWMDNGFDFACDSMIFRGMWLTHEPAKTLPAGTQLNIHGHLHNIWHGFHKNDPETNEAFTHKKLYNPWQRLFAVEYTEYRPVEFDKFVNHPGKFQATGPRIVTINGR